MTIKNDIQFINQIGAILFNYYNQKEPEEQKIWFQSLEKGLDMAMKNAESFLLIIPQDTQKGSDLAKLVNVIIDDYKEIASIIPKN